MFENADDDVMQPSGFAPLAALCGIVCGALLIVAVFASGQTFGQRCAAVHPKSSADWNACVSRLAKGGSVASPSPIQAR